MSQAFAPRMPRGFSWIWLSIGVIATSALPRAADAQAAPAARPAAPVEAPANEVPNVELFVDPNAKKALAKIEPLTFVGSAIKPLDATAVQNMAVGSVAVDQALLKRYVEFFAVELSKRDNINAMVNPPAGLQPTSARGMERAVDSLTDPMFRARANDRRDFLVAYNRVLFESSLVKLLENNLFSRIDAMIVLGMAGSNAPNALDLYTNQIKKPEQVVWVKMWAARGLTNATRDGKDNLDASKTIAAADALIGLLESDPKLPWPVQMRALEALGALRLSVSTIRNRVDAASVAMRFLADPDARPEVRAWAAWALGMMKVSPQVTPYNYELLGLQIGDFAADLGRLIVEEYDDAGANFEKEKDRATFLTGLLLFQVYPSLAGVEGVSESGLLRAQHPSLRESKPFLTKLDAKVKEVAREAYELIRAGGVAQKVKRDELDSKIVDLKALLKQTTPKDRHLVPGGPTFDPKVAQVAGAPRL